MIEFLLYFNAIVAVWIAIRIRMSNILWFIVSKDKTVDRKFTNWEFYTMLYAAFAITLLIIFR